MKKHKINKNKNSNKPFKKGCKQKAKELEVTIKFVKCPSEEEFREREDKFISILMECAIKLEKARIAKKSKKTEK